MATIDIKVPDIGDFKDVAVIELLVKPGDAVKVDQSLLTVESDKASMEIPSSHAGVVKELKIKVGDTVNQGSIILSLDAAEGAAAAPAPAADTGTTTPVATTPGKPSTAAPTQAPAAPAPQAASFGGKVDVEFDLVVLGSGPGGYAAGFRAADLGLKVAIIERFATLGGVCLNVGCIPSKALLHVAAVMEEAKHFDSLGVAYQAPEVDMGKLLAHKQKVVNKLTGGLAAMAKMRKVTVVTGTAEFVGANQISVALSAGGTQVIGFKRAIIAAGSEAVKLPFLPKDDPRIVTSTGALELRQHPKRMLIIGGGIIGLEMGTVYSTLGARLDVVEMLDGLMQGADRDMVKVWQKKNAPRFDNIMLKTKTVGAVAKPEGIEVSFEGEGAPAPQLYDLVLQAVGRVPNGKRIGADKAGVAVTDRGFINVDIQMRTNVPHIFAIGDIVGQPMLAHKATHEGHVAAEVIAGELLGDEAMKKTAFESRVIPSVAYTNPEVAWVGLTEDDAKARGLKVKKSLFPWNASGRAIANMADEGFTKLIFDEQTHQLLGGGIVGMNAGDLISEVALAVEMGSDAGDIAHTIHPHPTLGETVGLAAEVFEGACTDLPPVKR